MPFLKTFTKEREGEILPLLDEEIQCLESGKAIRDHRGR